MLIQDFTATFAVLSFTTHITHSYFIFRPTSFRITPDQSCDRKTSRITVTNIFTTQMSFLLHNITASKQRMMHTKKL